MPMSTTLQYLARKANEIFERNMQHAARKICERQSLFGPAA
jgi:hypothetical protein